MKALLSFMLVLGTLFTLNAQQYKPVDDKSDISFTIRNFGINSSGSLKGLKGIINFNPSALISSSFNVSVDVNTINTGVDARDSHLKKDDYFDVANHPTINFVSTSINGNQSQYTITGNLTIKGVTKTISFPFTVQPEANGLIFSGEFTINRQDFGVGGSSAVLSNTAVISLKVFAIKG